MEDNIDNNDIVVGGTAQMGNRSRSSSNGSAKNDLNGQEQSLVAQGSGSSGGGDGSNSPPGSRRRTKASRACDHCRKRKIKCDYSEERGICTSCSKNGEKCSFERVPLKRGPTKGYAKGHGRTHSMSSQQDDADIPSPPSRPASVLLPPLAQYLPQAGGSKAASVAAPPTVVQQQQFWKVPYHEFQNQRRGSIDSMQSDLSMGKSLNENLLYATGSGPQNVGSPTVVSNAGGNAVGDPNVAYWSFVRNSGSMIGPEEFEEMRRKSSSFPPIYRHSSNASGQQQQTPAVLYPYSQFTQQQQQEQQQHGKPPLNTSISSFGQFGNNGFESRQGSIVSENMSPGAPSLYQGVNMTPSASMNQKPSGLSVDPQQQQLQSQKPPQAQPHGSGRPDTNGSKSPSPGKAPKRRKRSVSQRRTRRADSSGSKTSESSSIRPPSCDSSRATHRNGIIYGQVSDVDLIDTYYEFIHAGFPIIPLNKQTLTNEILLVNTQPISGIHEINNYVILWFRNSLELLVRISLKKRYNQFFQAHRNDNANGTNQEGKGDADASKNSSGNRDHENNENDESLEVKSVFISALNECLQKIVDIHPRFRENKTQISQKIKIIYLSTFVLLNYILAFVGYDNSFVIGMSVTIFKEFKVYEQLVCAEIETSSDDEMSIMFKRLYVLLIILDSLQVCCYGGPQLLNFPIQGCTEKLFEGGSKGSKWDIGDDPIHTKCILQSLKLGEIINDLVSNRRSVRDPQGTQLIWESSVEPPTTAGKVEPNEPVTIMQIFHDFLFIKNSLTNRLLSLKDPETSKLQELTMQSSVELTSLVCELISLTLKILTLMMKLNPNNRIDYNYRPQTPLSSEGSTKDDKNINETITQSSTLLNRNGTDFYQKLLGLQQNNDGGLSEAMKGVISPYCISILHEIQNTNELIKQIPTLLIGVVMTISNKNPTADQTNIAKPQELVVELSNSMNEVVQITSLLNMIKPLRLFEQELASDSSWRYLTGGEGYDKSIMEKLYSSRNPNHKTNSTSQDSTTNPEQQNILEAFVRIGWKLLDDKELGWF